ncbi:MAG: SRPBCC family protein [Elusimicrobiota bacterium]|nr:MAG: SRPBCC family protein [Elusimicrobiota bacterium]
MLSVNRRILISAPHESVRNYLADLGEIAQYEPKVDSFTLSPAGDGAAEAGGRFLGIPWRGTFRFEFRPDGGYRGVMVSGPLRRMECRVMIRPVNGGTVLEHEEDYDLPLLLKPLRPLVKRWLDHTLETELDLIKERAEALNRKVQLDVLDG